MIVMKMMTFKAHLGALSNQWVYVTGYNAQYRLVHYVWPEFIKPGLSIIGRSRSAWIGCFK